MAELSAMEKFGVCFSQHPFVCVCVCVCAYARACVYVCVCGGCVWGVCVSGDTPAAC